VREKYHDRKSAAFTCLFICFSLCLLVCDAEAKERAAVKKGAANTVEAAMSEYAISTQQLEGLVGKTASVLLMDGKVLKDATLTKFTTRRREDRVAIFQLKHEGKKRTYHAPKVYSFKVDDNKYKVNYLPSAKAAAIVDVEKRRAAATKRLKKIRRKFWKEFTPEQQTDYVKKHKEFLKKVAKHFAPRLKMQLTETEYFLFLSDMPRRSMAPVLKQLDAMNEKLGEAFGYEPGYNIWQGKAVIVAFANREHFYEFEQKIMDNADPYSAQGLCHSDSTGRVVVGCYFGKSASYFNSLLVHETSHGYVARFRTNARPPSWLNEGIADWIAGVAVPANTEVSKRQRRSAQRLRTIGTFGGEFFDATTIDGQHYGSASSIVNLLMKKDPIRFKLFINGIKEGWTWQESLRRSYNASPEALCRLYGRSIGIPNLKP